MATVEAITAAGREIDAVLAVDDQPDLLILHELYQARVRDGDAEAFVVALIHRMLTERRQRKAKEVPPRDPLYEAVFGLRTL